MLQVVDAASLQEQHAQSTMRKCTIYDADLRQFEVDVRALRLPGLWHPSPLPSAADVVKVRGTPESVALELGIDINAGSSDAEEFDDSEGSDEGSHGQTQSAEKMRASEVFEIVCFYGVGVHCALCNWLIFFCGLGRRSMPFFYLPR